MKFELPIFFLRKIESVYDFYFCCVKQTYNVGASCRYLLWLVVRVVKFFTQWKNTTTKNFNGLTEVEVGDL